MNESLATHYLEDSIKSLRAYKKLAEKALDQLSEDEFFITLDEEGNSVAIIMKHMAGNMLSRWTDFLTSDGEKPNRNRDGEFEGPPGTREELLAVWERGWAALFAALDGLTDADLARTVTIRGEAHSVMKANNRQVEHLSY